MNNLSILQPINFDGAEVSFSDTAYLNATAIAQHFGKLTKDYLKTERTQEYINALAEVIADGKNILSAKNQLVIIKKGGNDKNAQGTWLHPKLAIDFARWLNPKFAVWCDIQISKILNLDENARPRTKTTTADRKPLVQAVNLLVSKSDLDYRTAHKMVHQYMGVDSIEDIALQDIPKAVEYVHRLICGSTNLDEEQLLYNEMWRQMGIMRQAEVRKELVQLKAEMYQLIERLETATKLNSIIYDAFVEPTRLTLTREQHSLAVQRAIEGLEYNRSLLHLV